MEPNTEHWTVNGCTVGIHGMYDFFQAPIIQTITTRNYFTFKNYFELWINRQEIESVRDFPWVTRQKKQFNPIGIVIQAVEHLLSIWRGFESTKLSRQKQNKQLKLFEIIFLRPFWMFNDCECLNGKQNQKQMKWIKESLLPRRERTTVRRWMDRICWYIC